MSENDEQETTVTDEAAASPPPTQEEEDSTKDASMGENDAAGEEGTDAAFETNFPPAEFPQASGQGDAVVESAPPLEETTDVDEEDTTTDDAAAAAVDEASSDNTSPSSTNHRQSLTRRRTSFVEPPPPFRSISDHSRADMHARLRAFESRRRSAYTAKLESSSLYWRSFRDLLQASVQETARAERLVVGTARAHLHYSNAMKASYQDGFLDDKGNVVMDAKRQAKLTEQRNNSGTKDGSNSTSAFDTTPVMTLEDTKRQHMLTTLIESQLVLSEKFGENAKHLEQEIVSEIGSLKTQLTTQVDSIQYLGNAILSELEHTETEVSKAWETYFTVASRVVGGTGRSPAGASELSSPTSASDLDQCRDVWVVEMHYRVSVAYQSAAWDKGSTELSTLFATMKDTECKRRVDLREYLVAFVQRQERLYHALPEVYTPVLRDLVGRDMDRNSIEEKVQATIRKRAETVQREEAKMKPARKRGSGLPTTVTKEIEEKGNFTLESPLMSELLCKAKVIEKKGSGMMSGWRTTLAVVTADAYLHLFELPPSSRVHNGSAPEVAFQAMIPSVQVPTAETIKSGRINFVKGWCDWLVPSESLSLANCAITTGLNDPHGSAFEITERTLSSGAKKMLGKKTTTRRLMLRTVTSKETEDWIVALKSQKYPKPPESKTENS